MNLFDEYTTLDNILVALPRLRAKGFNMIESVSNDSAAQDQAVEILGLVGLRGKEEILSASLSYGERRALEIGVALAVEPRILFLDEPTSGLGVEATARLAALIRRLKERYTIVVIEHDMHFLFALADQISVIHWGQVITQGTPDELRANKWVQESALGSAA